MADAPKAGPDAPHAPAPRTDAADSRIRRARLALLALAALIFVALRAGYLSVPLERDEGEYAYIAQRALAGDVPYRDAFDQKPPAIFGAYLAAFALFGRSVEAIHAFLYLWTAATCVALYALVRRAADPLAAAFAVLAFAVVSIEPRLTATAANTEIFMLLPLAASMALLLRGLERDGRASWLACGALAAAACWFKPVAIFNAAFVAAFALGDSILARSWGAAGRRAALLGAGALAVSLPVFLLFAALGAWEPFVDAVFLHNIAYAVRLPLTAGANNAAWALRHQAPALMALWLLAALALLLPRSLEPRSRALLAGFALASAAGVASGLYFRPHYFVQLLPALAALAGVTAASWVRPLLGRGAWSGGLGVAGAALLLVAPPLIANASLLGASPERISRHIYGLNPFVESARIADYIERTSDVGDSVYIVGSEPQILFHARRRSASRYIFFYPLTAPFPDALERQQGAMREVEAERPLYVVWVHLPSSLLVSGNSERWIFDASSDFVDRGYRLEFLARPPGEGGDRYGEFEFVFGAPAREAHAAARAEGTPWIAVFRRATRAGLPSAPHIRRAP